MTKDKLIEVVARYSTTPEAAYFIMSAVDAYLSASNSSKPIVSGSLCCRCGIRSKKIGDMCISCKHGWTGRQHNDRQMSNNNLSAAIEQNGLLPDVFYSDEMVSFGNFIRDNYYVAGSPKMLSYNPSKYPHAKVDEIFVYWCIENGR